MSFISDYAIYASNNEAPKDYHRWASLFVLSSLVSRKVWIDQGHFTIYPNLYVIFVGPPGNGKSTAMVIAQKMIRDFKDIPIGPASITKESLTNLLGGKDADLKRVFQWKGNPVEYTPVTFFANELTSLFGSTPIPMVGFFTDIYDREVYDVSTKKSGCDLVIGPYINLLGCMTPDITSQLVKQSIISGGFNRRCIFVNQLKRGDPVPFPEITPEMQQARDRCIAWGNRIRSISGQFEWEPSAKEWFRAWYNEKHKALQRHTDIVTQGYYVTKDVMLLKISMLIALSEGEELLLKKHHLEEGLKMLEYTEFNLSRVFSGTGRNALVLLKDRLVQILEIAYPNPVPQRKLEAELFEVGDLTEIKQVFVHCVECGIVQGKTDPNTGIIYVHLLQRPH